MTIEPTPHAEIRTIARANSGGQTESVMRVRALTPRERLARAAKVSSILAGSALFFVPIPFVHFFFVPGLLLAAAYFGLRTYAQQAMIDVGLVRCPTCSAEFELRRAPLRFPRKEHCPSCRHDVRLERAP